MLKDLLPLLRKGDTIGLSIAMEGDNQYRVNVMPKLFTLDGEKGADRLALNTPLTLTGTLEELDSPEFAATLQRFTASATTTRHTIEDVEAAHKTAAEAAKTKVRAAPATSVKERAAKALSDKKDEPEAEEETSESLI